jgi:hypothetical protein
MARLIVSRFRTANFATRQGKFVGSKVTGSDALVRLLETKVRCWADAAYARRNGRLVRMFVQSSDWDVQKICRVVEKAKNFLGKSLMDNQGGRKIREVNQARDRLRIGHWGAR